MRKAVYSCIVWMQLCLFFMLNLCHLGDSNDSQSTHPRSKYHDSYHIIYRSEKVPFYLQHGGISRIYLRNWNGAIKWNLQKCCCQNREILINKISAVICVDLWFRSETCKTLWGKFDLRTMTAEQNLFFIWPGQLYLWAKNTSLQRPLLHWSRVAFVDRFDCKYFFPDAPVLEMRCVSPSFMYMQCTWCPEHPEEATAYRLSWTTL